MSHLGMLRATRIGALVTALIAFSGCAATHAAAASLAGVATWAASGEEVQLGGVGGMAVNYSGAGGVPIGTLYSVGRGIAGEPLRVARWGRVGQPEKFSEAWEVKSASEEYVRCGPDGEKAGGVPCSSRPEGEAGPVDVAVDQTTGNVFVLKGEGLSGKAAIVEYSADGSSVITQFGIRSSGKATAETPEAIHESPFPGGIAVNAAGEVFVFDLNSPDNSYHRLMVFKPKAPGKYDEYVYAGEIAGGFLGEGRYPIKPVTDAAGNIYVSGDTYLEEYAPEAPGLYPHHSTSTCSFEYKPGGITAITVNPETGEPFFFSYKSPKRIHRLGPCEGGKFTEIGTIEVKPERDDLWGLAYDPKRKFSAGRPPGVLYGGAPGPVPTSGVGKGEPGTTSLGYSFAPAEENPPVIESESVSKVMASEARLEAVINPKNFQTRYTFQYLSQAAWEGAGESFIGATDVPLGGAVLGEGGEPIAAAVTVGGLEPDATYHYRVTASSPCSPSEPTEVCEVSGPDQFFNTYPLRVNGGLPDGRVYELVSPPQKNGGQVLPAEPSTTSCNPVECKPGDAYQHFPMQSSPSGDSIAYEGSPFFSGKGAVIENEYLSRRSAGGWGTENLTPGLLISKGGQGYKAFSPDLEQGVLEQTAPSLTSDAPSAYANLYRQPSGEPESLVPFLSEAPLRNHLPFNRVAGEGSNSLKLTYAGASADLLHVFFEANDALTEAGPFTPEAIDGGESKKNLYEWSGSQLRLVNVAPGNATTAPGAVFGAPGSRALAAISTDGSRAFWTSEAGQLYVRIMGEETREINHAAKFLTASADGSEVLLSDGCLYDLATESCEDLTAGLGGFQGIAGQNDDLSHVYFTDTKVLSEEENSEGVKAQAGKPNLYSWEEGETSFVATLRSGDSAAWQATPALRMAEASPNGQWLAFLSNAPLTGYDNNAGPCGICSEAFLYDAATKALTCASCSPANARPLGRTVLRLIKLQPALQTGEVSTLPQPRYLTDAGRLFFDSQDSLSPADTNGNVEDVYQFEPAGVGNCNRAVGCVTLISAGRGAVDSNFLAMDEDGDNVFFTSRDQLVPADADTLIDLYDARVGGGFASKSQLPPPGCGEACEPSSGSTQPEQTPSSPGFNGSGNVKTPKCKKEGQVKKNGRCVKRPKHSKNQKHKAKRADDKRGGAK
jgi:hypothetical protein